MALFRRGLPRRALVGAFVGFVFGLIVAPSGLFWAGIAWALLSVALLFARPMAYYAYLTWAILWMAWRGVSAFRGQTNPIAGMIEVVIPLASVALLSASGYLESTKAGAEAD